MELQIRESNGKGIVLDGLSDNELVRVFLHSEDTCMRLLAKRLDARLQSEYDAHLEIYESKEGLEEETELRDQQEAALHKTIESLKRIEKNAYILVNKDGLVCETGLIEYIEGNLIDLLSRGFTMAPVTQEDSRALYGQLVSIKLEPVK